MDSGNNIKERIRYWAEAGGDFTAGLSLFLSFNKNIFYAKNIEIKGKDRGTTTLISEFARKSGIGERELREAIARGKGQGAGSQDPGAGSRDWTNGTIWTDKNHHLKVGGIEPQTEVGGNSGRKRLREEFPFLGRKDCPAEMAIVVNKMLTAYDGYVEGRKALFEVDMNDQVVCYESGKGVLDDYILNRECWEELNYYKIHGKVLGKLPEFKLLNIKRDFEAMNTVALVKTLNNNIPRKMSYYKKQLADTKVTNKDEIRKMVAEREQEVAIIREILKGRGEL